MLSHLLRYWALRSTIDASIAFANRLPAAWPAAA